VAQRRRQLPSAEGDPEVIDLSGISTSLDRIAALLALHLIAERPTAHWVRILNAAGFSSSEIGALTGIDPGSVRSTLSKQSREAPRHRTFPTNAGSAGAED